MNPYYISALVHMDEAYNFNDESKIIRETNPEKFTRAKNTIFSNQNSKLLQISSVSPIEVVRPSGVANYMSGPEDSYILCRNTLGNLGEFKDAPLITYCDLYPMSVYTDSKDRVFTSSHQGELEEVRSHMNGRDSLLVVDTQNRSLCGINNNTHNNVVRELLPLFHHFRKANELDSAVLAAKVVASARVVKTMDYVSGLGLLEFKRLQKLINQVRGTKDSKPKSHILKKRHFKKAS